MACLAAALQGFSTIELFAERLSSAAAVLLLSLSALRRKTSMSDTPVAAAVEAPAAVAEAPIATAPVESPAPAIDSTAVVSSVIQTVQSHPAIPADHAASVIASILGGLYQAQPAIFAMSRASSKTQTEVGLGLGLLQLVLGAFLHPAG